jgi:hypothetical protein
MAPAPDSKSVLRAIAGTVSLLASLIVIGLGFVMLAGHAEAGGSWRTVVGPLAVLAAGGALLAFGIAMLIWELSIRYGIRR